MGKINVKVAGKHVEAPNICSFDLVPANDEPSLPPFTPGAHIDVFLPGGWVRQYSLWNNPQEKNVYRICVLNEANGRGGSRAIHEQVNVGGLLQIGLPRNQFELHHKNTPTLLLAGGIGITPILSMAQALAHRQAPFAFHYCARSPGNAAFLDRLAQAPLADKVFLHFDDGPPEQKLDMVDLLKSQPDDCDLYVCGPKGFMDAVLGTARALGWPTSRLHCEFFQADAAPKTGDQPFDVTLARSNRTVRVEAHQSVVQALAAAGIDIPTSCEQGICGTCLTKVVEGIPDHRDSFLMPAEQQANDCFTPCCSRALSASLTVDL